MTTPKNDIPPPPKQKLLFVDDEEGILLTLPPILQQEGFDVSVAASVPEALALINKHSFDILLTDLNIGSPADGFILVSAMRRVHPTAATFILTGYPDFQTALEAIRKQVDDYFTKPTDVEALVATLKEKAHRPRACSEVPCKRVADVVLENSDEIVRLWLQEVKTDRRLAAVQLSDEDRMDRVPLLLADLVGALRCNAGQIPAELLNTASVRGSDRASQGYTTSLLVAETRILNRVIAAVLYQNLLSINLSTLFSEALKIGEYLQVLLEESIRTFEATSPATRKVNARAGR
jgi:ActR/RegA family two-component response regulator